MIQQKMCAAALATSVALLGQTGQAQSLIEDKTATSGSTDVAAEGFQRGEGPAALAPADETSISLMAGFALTSGNTENINLTGGGDVKLRRDMDKFRAALFANYARGIPAGSTESVPTAENFQGLLRYGRLLTEQFEIFVQVSGRRDYFQNLDLRLNVDPGLGYYFINQEKQHLNFELGYDLQYDMREQGAVDPAAGVYATDTRHQLRAAGHYDNSMSDNITIETDLEYLQGFEDVSYIAGDGSNATGLPFRINWATVLSARIASKFQMAAGFTLRYDHTPVVPKNLDTITSLSLVYTLQ